MKKCPYCGTEVKDDAKYCHNCGYDVESIKAEVEHNYDVDEYTKDERALRDEFSKTADNALNWA